MALSQTQLAAIAQFAAQTNIPFTTDAALLANASQDFGALVQGQSRIIIYPRNTSQLEAFLQFVNAQNLPITLRAGGGSQSGQSVTSSGITVDTSRLDSIEQDQNALSITCSPGVSWRQLVTRLGPQGVLPCVMPMNLNLTVGGTLSAGGFGANSHCFGPVISNVAELEVLTGAGDRVSCSPLERPDVFAATLGGLGRCSVITAATLKLRPIRPHVRTYYLLYEDLKIWLADQQHLVQSSSPNYIEGFCSASIQGLRKTPNGRRPLMHWLYGLHVGVEFDPAYPPQTEQVLEGLHYNQLLHIEDDATVEYAARYDVRFHMMQQTGAWQQTHPWFECLLPYSVAIDLIPQILDMLPPFFGDGHRVMFMADNSIPKLFMRPDEIPAVAFAILPTGIPKSLAQPALEVLDKLNYLILQKGGKRYLSGWLGMMTEDSWKHHFGIHYDDWQSLKQRFDPNHILRSALFP
jgi:cytokinin dehydrogenase